MSSYSFFFSNYSLGNPSCRICNSTAKNISIYNATNKYYFSHYKCLYSTLPNYKFGRTGVFFVFICINQCKLRNLQTKNTL